MGKPRAQRSPGASHGLPQPRAAPPTCRRLSPELRKCCSHRVFIFAEQRPQPQRLHRSCCRPRSAFLPLPSSPRVSPASSAQLLALPCHCFGPHLWQRHRHTCQGVGTRSPGAPQLSPAAPPAPPCLLLSTTCTGRTQSPPSSDATEGLWLSSASSTSSRRIIPGQQCSLTLAKPAGLHNGLLLLPHSLLNSFYFILRAPYTCKDIKLPPSNLTVTPLSDKKVCPGSHCSQLLAKVPAVTAQLNWELTRSR